MLLKPLKSILLSGVIAISLVVPMHNAHAFIFKSAGELAVKGASKVIKRWIVYVAAKEGGKAALASLSAMKSLPKDPLFRASVLTALAGGSYAEARAIALDVAGSAAKEQVVLDMEKGRVFDDFRRFSGNQVEEMWNDADDRLTCGKGNTALEQDESGKFTVREDVNDELLAGRALLQRVLFTRMMANSTFDTQAEAEAASKRYSGKACLLGKSNKLMTLVGGFSIHKGVISASIEEPEAMFEKLTQWADKELKDKL